MFQGLKTSVRWMQQLAIPVAVLLLLSLARPVLAAEPQERMREILNAVAAVLKDPSLQGPDKQAERQQRMRQIILDTFDFEEMAKLALRPSGDRLTPQQRTEFVSLFGTLFERSYNNLVLRFLSERQSTYDLRTTGNPSRRIALWSRRLLSTRRQVDSSRSSTGSFTRTSGGLCTMSSSMG